MKCDTCMIEKEIKEFHFPVACPWYMEHALRENEDVEYCPDYEPIGMEVSIRG